MTGFPARPLQRAMAGEVVRFRFLDLDVALGSDEEAVLDVFSHVYRRFHVNSSTTAPGISLALGVFLHPDDTRKRSVLVCNRRVWSLPPSGVAEAYVPELLTRAIFAHVRSHILVHAAVVTRDGGGILLVGPSGSGKTTLALELVRRGFGFLSDETAALGRSDRRVHPFPRCLNVRPGTLKLLGDAVPGRPERGTHCLDIETLRSGSLARAVPVGHIFLLCTPGAAEGRSHFPVGVVIDRTDETLLDAVRRLDDVIDVRLNIHCGCPCLALRTSRPTAAFVQVERLCEERGIAILDVFEAPRRYLFSMSARLERMPRSQAVLELLSHLQNGYRSLLLQEELGSSPVHLYRELAGLVGQADCHRLQVGPLRQMADWVCRVTGTSR